jgi:hypothetical protein
VKSSWHLTQHLTWVIALVALAAAANSCAINRKSSQYECSTTADCDPGRVCRDGLCVVSGSGGPDAPPGPNDGGSPDGEDPRACPDQCTECADGKVCTIDCAAGANCEGEIACPPGWNCRVRCNEPNACRNGVDCSGSASCDVQCTAPGTCRDVACGPGRCNVNCAGQSSCRDIDCGDSCACEVKCQFGTGACTGITCSALQCGTGFGGCTTQFPSCNTCQ